MTLSALRSIFLSDPTGEAERLQKKFPEVCEAYASSISQCRRYMYIAGATAFGAAMGALCPLSTAAKLVCAVGSVASLAVSVFNGMQAHTISEDLKIGNMLAPAIKKDKMEELIQKNILFTEYYQTLKKLSPQRLRKELHVS